ncbi:hypothetical protein [Paenibacillus silvae]|uniref:hypothetical protein n=1 Tax=Paenibacillus silvae TaxID=1325358 RepID=UPI00142DDC66|nr:hypothetical protein [Paenibacillus silvae]
MNDPINDAYPSFTSSPGSIIRFTLDAEDKPVQPGRLNESRGQNTQGESYGFTSIMNSA